MTLRQRWDALPRSGRWMIFAASFIAAYFLVVEPALDARASLSAQADVLQAGIARRQVAASGASEAAMNAALAVSRFGPMLPPGGPERSAALNSSIERVLRGKNVSGLAIRTRALVPLGRTVFAGLIAENQQAQRLVLDVDFECAPALALNILSELEQAPEVTGIGRVIMRRVEREGAKTVQVSLSPETWIMTTKKAGQSP